MQVRPLAMVSTGFLCCVCCVAATPPHILMILADDLGWANVEWNRETPTPEVVTPNLAQMQRSGIELTSFHTFKYCSPTRSAIQSGRNPIHVNVVNGPTTCPGSGIPLNMT